MHVNFQITSNESEDEPTIANLLDTNVWAPQKFKHNKQWVAVNLLITTLLLFWCAQLP